MSVDGPPGAFWLVLFLEMEPSSKLNLTLANERITGAVGNPKVRSIRREAEVGTRECIESTIHTRDLVTVKEVECLSQNLKVGRFGKAETARNAQVNVHNLGLTEGITLEKERNAAQRT